MMGVKAEAERIKESFTGSVSSFWGKITAPKEPQAKSTTTTKSSFAFWETKENKGVLDE